VSRPLPDGLILDMPPIERTERALVGSMIVAPGTLKRAKEHGLRADHFSNRRLALIYAKLSRYWDELAPYGAHSLVADLEADGGKQWGAIVGSLLDDAWVFDEDVSWVVRSIIAAWASRKLEEKA